MGSDATGWGGGKNDPRWPVGKVMPYHPMSDDEVWAFLSGTPPHTGKLATTRIDGSPHVAPIWYAVDGRTLVFNTNEDSVKGRNLRRDRRVALCADDERPPFAYVAVEGTVELSDDLEALQHWAAIIGGRYMGEDKAAAYGARNGVPGELLGRLVPSKITGAAGVAS
jgi:PPOX class probable F420-dependent enzyme